jgi:Phosphotransferase enzyme family
VKRLDWRFVLPEAATGEPYRHLVLLGASDRVVDETVASGIAERVSRSALERRSADALVILDATGGAARNGLECLAPGGAVYWETRRPASARRALRRARVRRTADYWVLPSFEDARVYLPIDRSEATRWYLRSMFRATTPRERLLEPALQVALRLVRPLLAAAAPHHALTGVLGRTGKPALLSNPNQSPIMLTLGDAGRRLVLLPFEPGSRRPVSVLKLSRVANRNAATLTEQQVLTTLRAQLSPGLRASVPEPLGTLSWRGLTVGIESCAEGRLLSATTQGWGVPLGRKIEALRLVADWMGQLHEEAPLERAVWGDATIQDWVEAPLARYAQRFGVTAAERLLFDALRARARALVGRPLPLVWTHWGLRDQNIFRQGRKLVVVDWEGGYPGPPGFDLVYFVMAWYLAARRLQGHAAELQGLDELYCAAVPVQAAAVGRAVLHDYLGRLGLDRRFLPVLLVSMWVFRALGQSNEQGRAENRYTAYLGVLAAHVERLFGESASPRAPNQ